MKNILPILLAGILIFISFFIIELFEENITEEEIETVYLPEPSKTGGIGINEALENRRSRREFLQESLEIEQLSQILWSAQGITDETEGKRTAPSAGATYPIRVYLSVKENGVNNLSSGLYQYVPQNHTLSIISKNDKISEIARAAMNQEWIDKAAIVIILTAELSDIERAYGNKGERYAKMEAGHIGQNLYLISESLGLSTTTVGAFDDNLLKDIIKVYDEEPLYIVPLGKRK